MSELKPCPFCGSKDVDIIMHHHPRCRVCGCIQEKVIGCEAIPKWNARTESTELEQLRKAFSELKKMTIQEREWRLEDIEEIGECEARESIETLSFNIDKLLKQNTPS